jgi:hypothetical protein
MQPQEFAELLRAELPRLLREHPEVRHEIWGLMLEVFPSRQEFVSLLEELRAFREDSNRRFEAMERRFEALQADMDRRFEAMERRFEALQADMDRRFEAMERRFEAVDQRFEAMDHRFEAVDQRFEAVDRRFEALIAEMRQTREQAERRSRELELHLSALGLRVGRGLEHVIREVVEEFSGQIFTTAERLVLIDTEGVVFGVRGAQIEFDLYAANGAAYLVEVKSHVKPGDVLTFHRKAEFAAQTLGRPLIPLIVALSMEEQAERLMQTLGMQYRVRTRME